MTWQCGVLKHGKARDIAKFAEFAKRFCDNAKLD